MDSKFNGGLEPGSMHSGGKPQSSSPVSADADLIAQAKAMSGKALRIWKNQDGNEAKLNAALLRQSGAASIPTSTLIGFKK